MPIGSGAVYVPANALAVPGQGTAWAVPYADQDQIILRPTAPETEVDFSSAGWGGSDRCSPSSSMVLATVPLPADFLVPSGSDNNSAAILAADGETLIQVQPFTRCADGGVATSLVRAPDADLYGDGIEGAHGGSGLSSIGGTLRVGEMRPGQSAPAHALKFAYYMKEAYLCSTAATCYRWPADTADGYAVGFYGTGTNNPNANNASMVMGALLALPPSVDLASLGLETEPGSMLAWTLQNYGCYIDDDTYAPSFDLDTENGPDGQFSAQFESDWGFAFNQDPTADAGWTRDLQKLIPLLNIVDNNGPTSVGGGGTPRQPLAPPLP